MFKSRDIICAIVSLEDFVIESDIITRVESIHLDGEAYIPHFKNGNRYGREMVYTSTGNVRTGWHYASNFRLLARKTVWGAILVISPEADNA